MDYKIFIEAFFVWISFYFILSFIFSNKRVLSLSLSFGLILLVIYGGSLLEFPIFMRLSKHFALITATLVMIIVFVSVHDLRNLLENVWTSESRTKRIIASGKSVEQIVDAVFELSVENVGALITIEKYNTLDPYAQRAIILNSDISKEVLINIFSPNTPLHDGAVIIRGDKILCAAAYYTLSGRDNVGKTTGSRHRAGIGISEITDSLTIIVSEETGRISVAFGGILLPMENKERLYEYVNTAMK